MQRFMLSGATFQTGRPLKHDSVCLQEREAAEIRLPTGQAPVPTVDVDIIPTEQLTPLDNVEANAQVGCLSSQFEERRNRCEAFKYWIAYLEFSSKHF